MIKVFINQLDFRDGLNFYIVEQDDIGRTQYLLKPDGKGLWIREKLDPFQAHPEPTFQLSSDQASEFLKQMAERASERGIKLESDLKRDGKLEAMERHLDDMRRLVFSEVK